MGTMTHSRRRKGRSGKPDPLWKRLAPLAFLVLGLVVIVAIIIDMRTMERRHASRPAARCGERHPGDPARARGRAPQRSQGVLQHRAPRRLEGPALPRKRPLQHGLSRPQGTDISIMATAVDYSDFSSLLKDVQQTEKQLGMNMHIEPTRFINRPAIRRTCRLHGSKVLALDFVENGVAHHILCSVPPEQFEKYEPVLLEVLGTYQPHSPAKGSGGNRK